MALHNVAAGWSFLCDCGIPGHTHLLFSREKNSSDTLVEPMASIKVLEQDKTHQLLDFELKKVPLPPLGNFADISYLKENFKPHLLRDVCTLCSGALVSDSLLHMLL